MPPTRSDSQLLLIAGGLALFGGLLLAGVLFFGSGDREPRTAGPFVYGQVRDLERNLREEGPLYIADPFGGDDSIVFALEDGEPVALAVNQRDMPDCTVKWKEQEGAFACGEQRFTSDQLERFATEVPTSGDNEGILSVDVRRRVPAPAPPTTTVPSS